MQRLLSSARQFLPAAQHGGSIAELQRAGEERSACSACRRPPPPTKLFTSSFLPLAGSLLSTRRFSSEPDSHDDFKPQVKAAPAGSVDETIQQDISSHDVFIYMKVC